MHIIYITLCTFVQLFTGIRQNIQITYTSLLAVFFRCFVLDSILIFCLYVLLLIKKNTAGLEADIKGSGWRRFQAVIKWLLDRNVDISRVLARGRDPSSQFQKGNSGTVFCWKSALVLIIRDFDALGNLSLHLFRLYFTFCFWSQPHICNQDISVGSRLTSKNNPSQTAFYRYCRV